MELLHPVMRLVQWAIARCDPRLLRLLLLGFSSGLPAPLVFSNLSIWLREVGVSRTEIGLFALATTPYVINFLWAPLIDHLRLPWLTRRFGRRRGWALLTQVLLLLALLLLSQTHPSENLLMVAAAVLFVTFISATQDIVIDAYRIESLSPDQYAAGSAMTIWGWHLGGTLVGGAGGLYLAHYYGWNLAYQLLAGGVLVGMVTILLSPEPQATPSAETQANESQGLAYIAGLQGLSRNLRQVLGHLYISLVAPFQDFTQRQGWLLILVFIFVFKLGDALLGRMSGVFYLDMGFTGVEIAEVSKFYGLLANMLGVLLGGILAARIGLFKALLISGLATALTNLTYSWLAMSGKSMLVFTIAVVSDNFTGGLVAVAFVAYLSSLCNTAYTATQYALLSSLGNLARIWFSATSGWMVDSLDGDWALFFALTALIALLGLPLLLILMRSFPARDTGGGDR